MLQVPVSIVNASYGLAIGYCMLDVGVRSCCGTIPRQSRLLQSLLARDQVCERLCFSKCLFLQYQGYKESKKGGDVTRAVVKQSLFQGLASILLPFLIIHTQVCGSRVYACTQAQATCSIFSVVVIP